MRERKLLLLLSQAFIGIGLFFLYVQHVRSIFETRSNIEHGEQIQRESLLRREDALYFSFYKTLVEERDFWTGIEKLKNVTVIEYPNRVNVLQQFHILPEVTIAYFFHLWRYYTQNTPLTFMNCWRTADIPLDLSDCDMSGQAMQFYFEFVWILGGVTILIIYLYGTMLSHNIFGGIYAVVSYIMFHSYAGKIYEQPVARENFAFPFILLQMFYLCLHLDRLRRRNIENSRLLFIFTQITITTIALLSWQFSSIIFASQLLVFLMAPWGLISVIPIALSNLTADYAASQLIANGLAYYFSQGNKKYAFSWQVGPAIGLLCLSLARRVKHQSSHDRIELQSLKSIAMGVLLATSAQSTITDILDKSGIARSIDNTYLIYRNLFIHWGLQAKVSFTTSLAACNPAYKRMVGAELWELVKTLIVKPYCLYGVVMLANFFRKWRKSGEENKKPHEEYCERMKNYVLEDFLEEHHITMSEMSNKETEKELSEYLKMLEDCNFDYNLYKERKSKQIKDKGEEHLEFINDIKNLKEKISALNKKIENNSAQENTIKSSGNNITKTKTKSSKHMDSQNKNKTTNLNSNEQSINSSSFPNEIFNFQYIYSFIQMLIFTAAGLCIRKLFFLSFTLGCIIAPTVCSKFCFRKQRDIFWTISLTVFLTSIINPGVVNIKEEYFPRKNAYVNDDLDTMLNWIKGNTEKDAVFAGPIDIIGTVHLTTRRPIVNHAHLEMYQMSERTEYVYSIFSRQQSSDIYNQYSQLKIQYLIIPLDDCSNEVNDDCDLLAIWDDIQPSYRKYPQFCAELATKNFPSFLKVFTSDHYSIIKMFSQSVQINLKRSKMPEKSI